MPPHDRRIRVQYPIPLVSATQTQSRVAKHLALSEHHPAVLYLASLARSSRPGMLSTLRRVAAYFGETVATMPWTELSFAHMCALRSHLLEKGGAPSSLNGHLCAVRGVLRFAVRLGLMDRGRALDVGDVPPIRGHRVQVGRSVTAAELGELVRTCDRRGGLVGARDRALLAVFFGAGLRRNEVHLLNVEDILSTGELRVLGKGNKERLVPLPEGATLALEAWLDARREAGEPVPSGPLFVRLYKGRWTHERLSRAGIYYVTETLTARARVAKWMPHDARRTYAGELLDKGVDIKTAQDLLGHASPVTTAKYDRRGPRTRVEAAKKLSFPFQRDGAGATTGGGGDDGDAHA